jgi:type I restriction enzyme R subunit
LARLEREINEEDKAEIEKVSNGLPLKCMINTLFDALDPDKQSEKAKALFKTDSPTEEHVKKATEELAKRACVPFDDAAVRQTIIDVKRRHEQTIDTVSKDTVLFAGFDEQAKEKAHTIIDSFRKFIEENKDEITALQILYSKPYGARHLTYEDIKTLAAAIRKPPYNLTPEELWYAYERLEKSKVKAAGPQKLLTDIISLVRFAVGQITELAPFDEFVHQRFKKWISKQEDLGREFTPQQMQWLTMIRDHISTSLTMTVDDFDYVPFADKGGAVRAAQLFGSDLSVMLEELSSELVK